MDLDKCLFFIIPLMFRASMTTLDGLVFAILFVAWWIWLLLMFLSFLFSSAICFSVFMMFYVFSYLVPVKTHSRICIGKLPIE